jgi:N-acetylneuraminic acid mutarotase
MLRVHRTCLGWEKTLAAAHTLSLGPTASIFTSHLTQSLAGLIILIAFVNSTGSAALLGTAFTYQGRLADGGSAANGRYDLKFTLYDAASGPAQVGSAVTNAATVVSDGLFTVMRDFGVAFTGNARWLEIGVRSNGVAVDFTPLNPRQFLTPAPYALYAPSAGAAATATTAANANAVAAANVTGTLLDATLSTNVALRHTTNMFTATNVFTAPVGIDCKIPGRILQVGNPNTFGSQGMIRLASRSTNSAENRVWDIGVPQTGTDLTGAGYSFVIDDTQLGTAPEFIVHWGNGRVGIGRTNPATALDVNGTATATLFQGNGGGLTNLNATNLTGTLPSSVLALPSGMTVVSALANDPSLVTNGYRSLMTAPAPAWVNGSASNAPSARAGHTAVWDSQRLIVWGGSIAPGAAYVGSGAMFTADADQWETVSTITAPSARAGHTAVWSGNEMIVWGGYGTNGWLNTGGKFYPDQQLWRTVSTTNAPAERSGHIAVWTGSRMLVWGGQNATGLLNNGALYDPVSDQWSTLALANSPEARIGATAVWAGDRVLLWGGEGAMGVLSNGMQLRCSSGIPTQWVAMASANAPTARRHHTAIWTSARMLVWGGDNGGVPTGDGAAYDPAANAWAALSTTSAPVARSDHTAVWTGQEMLIVGGTTGAAELASGSAYDPATGLWRPLSTGNLQARTEATASWTGTEMLIFGGRAQGQYLGALQRLVPQPAWYFYRKL